MPSFTVWDLADVITTGPDPFGSNATGESDSIGVSTLTVNAPQSGQVLQMTDGDSEFTDGDSDQELTQAITLGGTTYPVGETVETEYAYVIRPVGSSDPADNVTIYSVEIDADVVAFASDGPLMPGQAYDFISIASNDPVASYSTGLFVCFATGTLIATPEGGIPVEDIRPGQLVLTADDGPQPVIWRGARRLDFRAGADPSQKPVLIKAGALGCGLPDRDLVLSPEHRVCLSGPVVSAIFGAAEVLVPAKSLTALPGVRRMAGRRAVTYHSLLLPAHAVLWADGARAESFYPTPYSLSLLGGVMARQVTQAVPRLLDDPGGGYGRFARRPLTAQEADVLIRAMALAGGPGAWQARPPAGGLHLVPMDAAAQRSA